MRQAATLPQSLVIPEPVAAEILEGPHTDPATVWLQVEGKMFIRAAAPELNSLSTARLGAGERAVIAWAMAYSGFTAVLDDYRARDTARQLGIKVLGTLGVLARLKRAGRIPELKPIVVQIRQHGGYISDALLEETLRAVGESP